VQGRTDVRWLWQCSRSGISCTSSGAPGRGSRGSDIGSCICDQCQQQYSEPTGSKSRSLLHQPWQHGRPEAGLLIEPCASSSHRPALVRTSVSRDYLSLKVNPFWFCWFSGKTDKFRHSDVLCRWTLCMPSRLRFVGLCMSRNT
jgi:hypothetical protein